MPSFSGAIHIKQERYCCRCFSHNAAASGKQHIKWEVSFNCLQWRHPFFSGNRLTRLSVWSFIPLLEASNNSRMACSWYFQSEKCQNPVENWSGMNIAKTFSYQRTVSFPKSFSTHGVKQHHSASLGWFCSMLIFIKSMARRLNTVAAMVGSLQLGRQKNTQCFLKVPVSKFQPHQSRRFDATNISSKCNNPILQSGVNFPE